MRTETYRRIKRENPELLRDRSRVCWQKRWRKIKSDPVLLRGYRDRKKVEQRKYNWKIDKRWQRYQYGAKNRGILWEIDYESFFLLVESPCYYCGDSISKIGLDRKNNRVGYKKNNVVPCCKDCNRMKGKMSESEFVRKCILVAKRQ
ncbi:MAG: hypothetical protein HY376_03955 [Candidatus Blackburnbacteria bacterium]|nr:hypothetical protein [Candidatus Blackburnbacteria bacterium]